MDEKGEHFPQKGVDCRSRVVPLTVQPALRASCAGNETRDPDNARAVARKEGLFFQDYGAYLQSDTIPFPSLA